MSSSSSVHWRNLLKQPFKQRSMWGTHLFVGVRCSLRVLDTRSLGPAPHLPISLAVPPLAPHALAGFARGAPVPSCPGEPGVGYGRWAPKMSNSFMDRHGEHPKGHCRVLGCANNPPAQHSWGKLLTLGTTGPPPPHSKLLWARNMAVYASPKPCRFVPALGGDIKAGRAALAAFFPQTISIFTFPRNTALSSAAASAIWRPEEDKVMHGYRKGWAARCLACEHVWVVFKGTAGRETQAMSPDSAFSKRLCAAGRAENLRDTRALSVWLCGLSRTSGSPSASAFSSAGLGKRLKRQ